MLQRYIFVSFGGPLWPLKTRKQREPQATGESREVRTEHSETSLSLDRFQAML